MLESVLDKLRSTWKKEPAIVIGGVGAVIVQVAELVQNDGLSWTAAGMLVLSGLIRQAVFSPESVFDIQEVAYEVGKIAGVTRVAGDATEADTAGYVFDQDDEEGGDEGVSA